MVPSKSRTMVVPITVMTLAEDTEMSTPTACEASTFTPVAVKSWKPPPVTTMSYEPVGRALRRKSPFGPVVAVRVWPVAFEVATTVAPETGAPVSSVTWPVMAPEV